MFRIGDATLVDLATERIDGIGELKTQRVGANRLSLQFVASMDAGIRWPDVCRTPQAADRLQVLPKQQARLDKQLARISKTTARAKKPPSLKIELQADRMAHIEEVDEIVRKVKRGGMESRQLSPGLLLVAHAPTGRSLLSRLTDSRPTPVGVLDRLPEQAKRLLPPDLANNTLIISRAFYHPDGTPTLLPGATPMLMWPLDGEVQRALVLGTVSVYTLFNPAHLFGKLEDRGWTLGLFEPPAKFSLKRKVNGKTLELRRAEYFVQLVSHSLYREE